MKPCEVIVSASAAEDLEAGREFYDAIDDGLGSYFIESLLSDIESLRLYVGIHRKQHGLYCYSSKRFPFSLYYIFIGEEARIVAVLDQRQNPNNIRSSLAKRKSD